MALKESAEGKGLRQQGGNSSLKMWCDQRKNGHNVSGGMSVHFLIVKRRQNRKKKKALWWGNFGRRGKTRKRKSRPGSPEGKRGDERME